MLVLPKGVRHIPGHLDRDEQQGLLEDIRAVVVQAPLYRPEMPRSGKPFSVRMTNCGELGWVADKAGYRYQDQHPVTGAPWPPIPQRLLKLWDDLTGYPRPPQACLVNFYDTGARMGLHQDRDESDFSAPVLSISLGDACLFRIGGTERRAADPIVPAGKRRRGHSGRRKPAGFPWRRPDLPDDLDPAQGRWAHQPDAPPGRSGS
jgi:alkylated DNA repair protein (DNA oxidative demethylase)